MVLSSSQFKCTFSVQITFKELSFNFGIEVNLASRRLQCKVSPKSMDTVEKLSLHLKHSVYLVSTVEVGWTALMKGIVSPEPEKKKGTFLPILYVHPLRCSHAVEKIEPTHVLSSGNAFPWYWNFVSVLAGCPAKNKGRGLFRPSSEKSKEYCCRYYMSTSLGALIQWKR